MGKIRGPRFQKCGLSGFGVSPCPVWWHVRITVVSRPYHGLISVISRPHRPYHMRITVGSCTYHVRITVVSRQYRAHVKYRARWQHFLPTTRGQKRKNLRGIASAEDALGRPTQSHISPSILSCEDTFQTVDHFHYTVLLSAP